MADALGRGSPGMCSKATQAVRIVGRATLFWGGNTAARGSRGGDYHPGYSLRSPPGWPPHSRGSTTVHSGGPRSRPITRVFWSSVPIFTDFSDSVVLECSYMTTSQTDHCFFFRFDLQRNGYIRSVVLVEANSILLLFRCLEASE